VQGYTAGRIPGVSPTPDADGYFTYTRPEGKQGGHGVGWSELPRYSFLVAPGWEERPVSIADLGGTEIDLRYTHPDQGDLEVVVAPIMRFMNIDFNANVRIEDVAPPERIIDGFALEIFGGPLTEGDVLQQEVNNIDGLTYYSWEVKPHRLVTATAVKNRLILMSIQANSRQWRKAREPLLHMWKSLRIVSA
jgi:hypothetical protein